DNECRSFFSTSSLFKRYKHRSIRGAARSDGTAGHGSAPHYPTRREIYLQEAALIVAHRESRLDQHLAIVGDEDRVSGLFYVSGQDGLRRIAGYAQLQASGRLAIGWLQLECDQRG